jgi:hypothetical protein
MASLFQVHKNSGDIVAVSARTMLGMLADPYSAARLMRELAFDREVEVELRDGPAKVKYADPLPKRQRELPIIPYDAQVNLVFVLPALVKCRASSEMEAKHTIEEILLRAGRWPSDGFDLILRPEDLKAFIESLEIKSTLAIQDVEFLNVYPCKQLTHERRT